MAAYTTTGCVIASGLVWVVESFRVSSCIQHCAVPPAAGGILVLLISPVVVVMAGLALGVRHRLVDPDGGWGWMFGLSAIFAFGLACAVTRIPSLTCPAGSGVSFFKLCYAKGGQIPPGDWRWLKYILDLAGVIVGFTLVRSRRWVAFGAPIAGAVWLAGTGDLLFRRLLRS